VILIVHDDPKQNSKKESSHDGRAFLVAVHDYYGKTLQVVVVVLLALLVTLP